MLSCGTRGESLVRLTARLARPAAAVAESQVWQRWDRGVSPGVINGTLVLSQHGGRHPPHCVLLHTLCGLSFIHCFPLGYETEVCHVPCPLDCKLSAWTAWTACSASCGGGLKTRSKWLREKAFNGGRPCPKLDMKNQVRERGVPPVQPVRCLSALTWRTRGGGPGVPGGEGPSGVVAVTRGSRGKQVQHTTLLIPTTTG